VQVSLKCKRAIVSCRFLDVDLTVNKNLILKQSHHYLMKLYKKNFTDVSMVGSTSNDP
jgi:hypothetical protein